MEEISFSTNSQYICLLSLVIVGVLSAQLLNPNRIVSISITNNFELIVDEELIYKQLSFSV